MLLWCWLSFDADIDDDFCSDDDYLQEKSEAWKGCWIIMLMFSLFQRGHTWDLLQHGVSSNMELKTLKCTYICISSVWEGLQNHSQGIDLIMWWSTGVNPSDISEPFPDFLDTEIHQYIQHPLNVKIWTFCRWQWLMCSTSPTRALGDSIAFSPSGAAVSIRWENTILSLRYENNPDSKFKYFLRPICFDRVSGEAWCATASSMRE